MLGTALIQGTVGYRGTTLVVTTPLYAASYHYQRVPLGHQLDDQDNPYSLSKDQPCRGSDIIKLLPIFRTPTLNGVHVLLVY